MEILEKLNQLRIEHPKYQEEISLTMARIDARGLEIGAEDKVKELIGQLCKSFNCSLSDFNTKRKYAMYRQAISTWLSYNTTLTQKEIKDIFGYFDRTSITYANKMVKNALKFTSSNQELSDIYHKIIEELG